MSQQGTFRKLLPLAGAVMIWGGNWPVMKLGLAHMSPLWLAASRFGSAALISVAVLALLGAEPSLRVTPLSGKHGRAQTRLIWRADDETPALQALRQLLAQRRQ